MDEMVNTGSEGQSNYTSEPSSSAPSESRAPSPSTEKVFTQSEINDIVGRAKQEAVESYKRKAERTEYAQRDTGGYIPPHQQPERQHSAYSSDDIRRMAAEESQRLRDEWVTEASRKSQEQDAQRIVSEFFNKLSAGKEKYQDFDDVAGTVEFSRFPNVVQLLHSYVDNAHDVMYELGRDRGKLALLEQLSHMSPNDAIFQVRRLSQSIKDNESAGKMRTPSEPLSQMRPSNTGTGNGGMSISDYRKKYRV